LRRFPSVLVLLALALGSAACTKVTRWRQNQLAAQPAAALQLPKRAGQDPTPAAGGVAFDIDERSGRPKPSLILRLDHFPAPVAGEPSLPACYPPFPADFELGYAACADKPGGDHVAVSVRNVEQDCYTNPKVARTPSALPLIVPGCRRGILFVYDFAPPLRIDAEVRDVN
jgi:hypothetical protein